MQFDGGDEGNYTPPKPLAPAPSSAMDPSDDRIARASAAQARQKPAASAPTSVNTTNLAGIEAASALPYKPGLDLGSSAKQTKTTKAKTPVDKSGYDRSIKVPQATVDAVKKDGAKVAANKVTYGSPGYDGSTFSPTAPVSKEYKEATKRVYPNAKSTPPNASGATNPNQPGPKAAAPKAAAPKASAFPPILPAPSKPKATPKPNSAAALPPLMTPPTPKASAPAKVKVSQSMVDSVKKDGKAKAIANAKTNVTNAEYKEAVKRIYQSPAKPKAKAKSGGGGGGKASSAVK